MKKQLKLKDLSQVYAQVPPNYYERGTAGNFLQHVWHGRKWNKLNTLSTEEPKKILDVGCASGYILVQFKRKFPNSDVVGVDVSPFFIDFAQKQYPQIKFIKADAHKLPLKNDSFDLVICTETLEHVVYPRKILREIKRILKPSGYALISMDTGSWLFRIVWRVWTKIGPGRVWGGSHIFEFNKDKLEDMVKKTGFKIVNQKTDMFGMAVYFKVIKPTYLKSRKSSQGIQLPRLLCL